MESPPSNTNLLERRISDIKIIMETWFGRVDNEHGGVAVCLIVMDEDLGKKGCL